MKETKQLTDLERVRNVRETLLEIKKINQSLKEEGTYSPSRFTDSEVSILMPVAAQPKAKE
jgi:hypothetical protein